MPTLSQWKILSRLLLKRANEVSEAAHNDKDGYEQGSDQVENPEEMATRTGHELSQTHKQNLTKELESSSRSPGGMIQNKVHQSIPEESTLSSSLASYQQVSGDKDVKNPSDALDSSRSIGSPKLFHIVRPKSAKVVRIQDDMADKIIAENGMAFGGSKTFVTSRQQISDGAAKTDSICETGIGPVNSGLLIKEEPRDSDLKGPIKVISSPRGKEKSILRALGMGEFEQSPHKNPTRPCLKRSDSCFIRRPDSRTKIVTFGRPFSSTHIFKGDVENITNKNNANKPKLVTMNESLLGNSIQSTGSARHFVTNISTKNTELNLIDGQAAVSNATRIKRPSSSGPTFWRAAQMVATVNKVGLARKASFPVEWQASGSPGVEKSLPRSPAFRVRRDSTMSRNFQGGQGFGQAMSPHSTLDFSLSSGLKVASNEKKEVENYEPYVIRNGHLMKRNSKSSRIKDVSEKTDSEENAVAKILKISCGLDDVKATKFIDTHIMETQHGNAHINESLPCQEERAVSQYSLRDDGLQHSQQEERPSSQSRVTTPTTMVALTQRVTGTGSVRSGDAMIDNQVMEHVQKRSFSDGNGALRRWSKVHQAIVSADQFCDNTEPDGESRSNIQLDDLDVDEQAELQKLGFRKPSKGKKKKKKKRVETRGENQSSSQSSQKKNTFINLKEDPVLIKVSKKNQNVGKFSGPPELKPNAVCFEIQGSDLTHGDVKTQVQRLLRNNPEVKLIEIQFHHRSLVNNIKDMHNRWIITTNSVEGRNRLAGATVSFPGFQAQLRRYDDIVNTEFQQFTRMSNFAKMMVTRLGNGGK
ncbi:hypothetical protein RRG08_038983 [Elysia crispata]|uniref:Uncharacterized protein n=1 Tax=Elysia crispata TaxID=231223 RepID=A0AAE1CU78_9GAST|nr:hypothetical protein RRG08_038983 [Elysia crispata]